MEFKNLLKLLTTSEAVPIKPKIRSARTSSAIKFLLFFASMSSSFREAFMSISRIWLSALAAAICKIPSPSDDVTE
jgi:hypothetical protein